MAKTNKWFPSDPCGEEKAESVLNYYFPPNGSTLMTQEVEMEVLNLISPVMRFVVDFQSRGYAFVSENIEDILGVTSRELAAEGIVRSASLFWEGHRPVFFDEMLPLMMEWFKEMADTGKDNKRARLVYNLCMNHANGKIISTMHIMKPIKVDEFGFPLLAVKYICDITDHKPLVQPDMKMEFKNDNGEYERINYRSFFFNGETGGHLSAREQEILNLVKKGFSSKDIADKLCLSLHTVNNHRKNIAQKCKVKSLHQISATSPLGHT